MTGTAVHFGTMEPDTLAASLRAFDPSVEVLQDGDGWNAWGEEPGMDENDPLSLHVVAYARDADAARRLFDEIPGQHGDLLVSMSSEADWGVVAALTSAGVWSECFATSVRDVCPRCGLRVPDPTATSRLDSATSICTSCENTEAIEDALLGAPRERRLWADALVGLAPNGAI